MQPWPLATVPVRHVLVVIVGIVIVVAGYAQYETSQAQKASDLWWQQEYARQAREDQAIAQQELDYAREAERMEREFAKIELQQQADDIADRLKVLEDKADCEQLYRSSYRNSGYSLSQVCP